MARRSANPVSVVWVLQRAGASGATLLEEVLAASGFWEDVSARRGPVVIKPDLDCYEAGPHAGTDPALVEHLIDLLYDRGFDDVAVADARTENDDWLYNRDPMAVPELVGYRFETPRGRRYAIVDGRGGAAWKGAALRIGFAKNRTHEDCLFALSVHNLAALAPVRRSVAEDALAVLRDAPPHWCLIDAVVSAHGSAGHRAPKPLATHTLIACRNALLADWAAAARMGLDPYASPVNSLALHALGLPPYHVEGDLSPYPMWRNVHTVMAHAARLRNASDGLGAMSAAWFQTVDRERFALRDFYSDRLNAMVTPLLARADENPRAFWMVVALNLVLARIDGFVRAQQTLFAKDRLRRRESPLLMDPHACSPATYDAIEGGFAPCDALLRHLPAARNGLRWRHVDGAILFGNEHVLPLPYDRFVQRVDIAKAIRYMNDYIGGATVVVRRDRRGRALHQAERNLYLQQPNWMVLFGGEVIDVEKIECIRRRRGQQTIHWRTLSSPNGSARIDDGGVAFTRTAEGLTHVRVFGRQQFSLPTVFRLFDIDLAPGLRDPIIESAYTTYFEGTLRNLQLAYDGQEYRIGRDASSEDPQRALPRFLATAAAALAELLREGRGAGGLERVAAWITGTGVPLAPAPARAEPLLTDSAGFRHFAPPAPAPDVRGREDQWVAGFAALVRDAPDVLQGLADAVHHDLDALANAGARE
ncbi:MAG TPA: DUF362 domain-containing protein [Rhodanobacteraceae bacterium]|nr:DUF362 domain-containing protein [Rhodanobacteraceae bacterium]